MSKRVVLPFLACSVLATAAYQAHGQAAPAPKASKAAKSASAAPADPAADAERRSTKVATFGNGAGVTVGDLEDAVARQSPHVRKRFTEPSERKSLLDKSVRFALLAEEAERRGYGRNPIVQQAVKQNAVQALMKTDFAEDKYAASITEADVKAYYDAHRAEYERPALRRASHIVVATLDEAKTVLEEAKAAADLRAFRVLAREKSLDDTNKLRGGDLQYFDAKGLAQPSGEAVVPEAVAKAVMALKNVGDVAPQPIKIDKGYSIVKLTGERPALSRKLAEVADSIRTRLARTRRQEAIDAHVAALREQHKPEVHAERIEAIVLDPTSNMGAGMPHGLMHGGGPTAPGAPHAPEQAPEHP